MRWPSVAARYTGNQNYWNWKQAGISRDQRRKVQPQALIMSLALCGPTSDESSATQALRNPAGSATGS